MACGGLKFLEVGLHPRFDKNYTQRVVELSLEMVRLIQSSTFSFGTRLNLKIGVHHGSCIYGVIGYHKPQFSLIGDTVNTTSRHCTTGDTGSVVLSTAAKARIDASRYPQGVVKMVPMKGKGMVEVFMIPVNRIIHPFMNIETAERSSFREKGYGSSPELPQPITYNVGPQHSLAGGWVNNNIGSAISTRRRATIFRRKSGSSPVLGAALLLSKYSGEKISIPADTGDRLTTPNKLENRSVVKLDSPGLDLDHSIDYDRIIVPEDPFSYYPKRNQRDLDTVEFKEQLSLNTNLDHSNAGDTTSRNLVNDRVSTPADDSTSDSESFSEMVKNV